jgi:hypothetical protein
MATLESIHIWKYLLDIAGLAGADQQGFAAGVAFVDNREKRFIHEQPH